MNIWDEIISTYPELTDDDFNVNGCIELRDDGDGIQYIAKWNYSKPIPKGLKLGK
jgi:hypothetical protein